MENYAVLKSFAVLVFIGRAAEDSERSLHVCLRYNRKNIAA